MGVAVMAVLRLMLLSEEGAGVAGGRPVRGEFGGTGRGVKRGNEGMSASTIGRKAKPKRGRRLERGLHRVDRP